MVHAKRLFGQTQIVRLNYVYLHVVREQENSIFFY